jgi:hypothetical protein
MAIVLEHGNWQTAFYSEIWMPGRQDLFIKCQFRQSREQRHWKRLMPHGISLGARASRPQDFSIIEAAAKKRSLFASPENPAGETPALPVHRFAAKNQKTMQH